MCSMIEGKINPYYSLEVKPRKNHIVESKNLAPIKSKLMAKIYLILHVLLNPI